jgi:hypothetical protein
VIAIEPNPFFLQCPSRPRIRRTPICMQ